MQRRAEFRPFGWLHDLWKRNQLDLSPPYQRRSVWSEKFKLDFVDTVLLNYPCPAIFLYEVVNPDGSYFYKIVDGKQRLTTLFDFVSDKFVVSESSPISEVASSKFSNLSDDWKRHIWRYSFSVEFIEQENELVINSIFDRMNKNVAKLSHQELRHAKFSGVFSKISEEMSDYCLEELPLNFPNIAAQSRRQMKDVENASLMLLFVEIGEKSMSQADLDHAYSEREDEWEKRHAIVKEFKMAIRTISLIIGDIQDLSGSRLRNQADFYSFFGAIVEIEREQGIGDVDLIRTRLLTWLERVRNIERGGIADETSEAKYLEAARSASNDAGPRRVRIDAIKKVILGD